jgi:hypothetical protein
MYPFILPVLLSLLSTASYAQRTQRVMMGVHADLIKTDNDGLFEKMQGGFEGSYYLSRKFALTTGVEWWSDNDNPILLFGARFCPIDEAYFRIRGLLQNDLAVGAGFARPLSDKLRVEALADIYFSGQIAIRAGIAYGIGRNP